MSAPTCGQDGCTAPAAYRFTWPGRTESHICERHAPKLRSVAAAMGLSLQLLPVVSGRPYVTELRPTAELVDVPLNAVADRPLARRWTGRTDDGIEVDLYVVTVRVAHDDGGRFERRFRPLIELAPESLPDAMHAPRSGESA